MPTPFAMLAMLPSNHGKGAVAGASCHNKSHERRGVYERTAFLSPVQFSEEFWRPQFIFAQGWSMPASSW